MCLRGVIALGLILTACGMDPSGGKKTNNSSASGTDEEKSADQVAAPVGSGLDSETAFAETLYPLLQDVSCKACHATEVSPFFAVADAKQAHQIIMEAKKVDLASPIESRLYKRLAEDKHNCWSPDCNADAKQMLSAIEAWKQAMQKPAETVDGASITTDGLGLADAIEKTDVIDARTIVVEAESGTLVVPMRSVTLAAASGGRYIDTPVGNGQTLAPNAQNAGRITYSVNVNEAGVYRLWARISAATATQNSFYIRVDGGTALNWLMPVTNGQLSWQLASDQDTAGNILQFNLSAGAHSIEIRQREGGTRLDMFAFSKDPSFRGDVLTNPIKPKVLRFPLGGILGESAAYFEIEVTKYDDFSFMFKNPSIKNTQKKITVKGIRVLLNGKYDPQTATYTKIDTVVDAPGGSLSSAAMIVPFAKSADEDEISISFDHLSMKD